MSTSGHISDRGANQTFRQSGECSTNMMYESRQTAEALTKRAAATEDLQERDTLLTLAFDEELRSSSSAYPIRWTRYDAGDVNGEDVDETILIHNDADLEEAPDSYVDVRSVPVAKEEQHPVTVENLSTHTSRLEDSKSRVMDSKRAANALVGPTGQHSKIIRTPLSPTTDFDEVSEISIETVEYIGSPTAGIDSPRRRPRKLEVRRKKKPRKLEVRS